MIKDCIRMAVKNLSLNRKRSALTMLGVLIGVASIIALISLITAASNAISDSFAALGTDTLVVKAYGSGSKDGLTEEDIVQLGQLDGVQAASPTVSLQHNAYANGTLVANANIVGKDQNFFQRNKYLVIAGRRMNRLDIENSSKVCWISHMYINKLIGLSSPVGQTIIIKGVPFVVAGVMIPEAFVSAANMLSSETAFIIPYTTALSLSKTKYMDTVTLYVSRDIPHSVVAKNAEAVLKQAFSGDGDAYYINDMKEYESSLNELISMMTMLLIGTAGISLLVGGIGIMNMMLTTVSERTVEIGLKKAIGAFAWVIQLQFLTESVILSLIGGGIGMVVGILLSYVVCMIMGVGFTVSVTGVALGVGFSVVVGLIFGWAPAKTASRMKPIDALRSI